MKILFYIHSPSTYQIELYEKLRKYFEIYFIFKNKNLKNKYLKFKKKNWIYFLSKKSKTIYDLINKLKPQIIILGGYVDLKIKDKNIKIFF